MFKVGDTVQFNVVQQDHNAAANALAGLTAEVVYADESYFKVKETRGTFRNSRAVLVKRHAEAVQSEADPNGISQHAPGAKLDAGKLRPELVFRGFANALACVARVGTDGAAKYSDDGWREVPNGFARYCEAESRHRLRRNTGEVQDKDSKSLHLAHEAWNALAKLELFLANNPEYKEI